VLWDEQDLMLEDVERIEVIRGPGATMWGANAVNGVINIITKSATQTHGLLVSGEGGAEHHYSGEARYGGTVGKHASYRVFVRNFNRVQSAAHTQIGSRDRWQGTRGGFRLDSDLGPRTTFMASGDLHGAKAWNAVVAPQLDAPYAAILIHDNRDWGGDILSRLTHSFSALSEATLQFYYERRHLDDILIYDRANTADADFQHRWSGLKRNEIVWGMGYRWTMDHMSREEMAVPHATEQSVRLFSGFLQDEVTIVEKRLRLMAGSKFEHNSVTGWEVQPNARALWTPTDRRGVWCSVARAVRTPSVGERTLDLTMGSIPPLSAENPTPFPAKMVMAGSPDFSSERLIAYEAGYRAQYTDWLGVSTDVFYNHYSHLRSISTGTPVPILTAPEPYVLLPLAVENRARGHSQGLELTVDIRPVRWWRLAGAYTFLHSKIDAGLDSTSGAHSTLTENVVPAHQVCLRSALDIGSAWELDVSPRYVSKLENSAVQEYWAVDLRAGWKPSAAIELFAVAQDLGDRHFEFDSPLSLQTLAARTGPAVFGGMIWRWGSLPYRN
jgi:iron complex outermembrane receptor protein